MNRESSQVTPGGLRRIQPHLPAAGLFLLLALTVTRPLWIDADGRIGGRGDALLNSYILDWVHYAIFHQITDFFQATAFWPHADSLAYGEHLLVPALLVLPLRAVTSSAVALHNYSVVQACFFCALAAYALGWFHFRRRAPALTAGLVYGFAQYRLVQQGHIQLAHAEFLPLAVLATEVLLRRESFRASALLGGALAAQALTSWYWAVFTFWVIGPFLIIRLWQSRAIVWRPLVMHLLIPCVGAVLAVIPMALPYMELTRKNILVRPPEASEGFSARPGDYLEMSPRYWLGSPVGDDAQPRLVNERQLHPGVAALSLILCGMLFALARDGRVNLPGDRAFPVRAWAVLLVLMLVFSLGSSLRLGPGGGMDLPMPYWIVEKVFPFSAGVRVTARWMLPALLPAALLAAFAVWRLQEWLGGRGLGRAAKIAPAAMVLLLAGDAIPRPARFLTVPETPPKFCLWLAKQPFPAPVIELPILEDTDNLYMLHATWHRQPTMNGTNGFFPPGHQSFLREAGIFGSPNIIPRLREAGVKHIIIHANSYDLDRIALTPMGRLLGEAREKFTGGEFPARIFGEEFRARWMDEALVVDL